MKKSLIGSLVFASFLISTAQAASLTVSGPISEIGAKKFLIQDPTCGYLEIHYTASTTITDYTGKGLVKGADVTAVGKGTCSTDMSSTSSIVIGTAPPVKPSPSPSPSVKPSPSPSPTPTAPATFAYAGVVDAINSTPYITGASLEFDIFEGSLTSTSSSNFGTTCGHVPVDYSSSTQIIGGPLAVGQTVEVIGTNQLAPGGAGSATASAGACPNNVWAATQIFVLSGSGSSSPTPTPSSAPSSAPTSSPTPTPTQTSGSGSGSCVASNYTQVSNSAPLPANFCAFAALPFHSPLPANPQNIDTTNTSRLQNVYAPNSPPGVLGTVAVINAAQGEWGGSSYTTYVAQASDPLVSVNCAATAYGCSDGNGNVITSTPSFHVPAYAIPTCLNPSSCGDANISVVQPNGDIVSWYYCIPSRQWQNGDVIGSGSVCSDVTYGLDYAAYSPLASGLNSGNINGGDDFTALPIKYEELAVAKQINHSILVDANCVSGSVYPGKGAMNCADGNGIPSGAHWYLNAAGLAYVKTLIANGTEPAWSLPVFVALNQYGAFTFDTAGGSEGFATLQIEQDTPMVAQGLSTPWLAWFESYGGSIAGDGGVKIYGQGVTIDWRPLAPYLYVLSACYAQGTCSN